MRLIDADALKEAVNTKRVVGRFNTIQLIDNAPTVEPTFGVFKEILCTGCDKRPHGEWIVGEYMDCHSDILPQYTCPFCGEVAYRKYDYCHCGADMRGIDR